MAHIIFVTGTDTGVGKTLLTALLLRQQRQSGVRAFGLKPIASGGREDARILASAQGEEIELDEINPYYFRAPIAPALAARRERKSVHLGDVLRHVEDVNEREGCELLLVEGAGGVLVPLGDHFTVLDLIGALQCPAIIVAPNKLGVVNHVLLTVHALARRNIPGIKVVLMNQRSRNLVAATNAALIGEWSRGVPVLSIPYLGRNPWHMRRLSACSTKLKKTLAQIVRKDTFSSAFDVGLQR